MDYLTGLKENVIIGRLIPANLEGSAEGRARLGLAVANGDQEVQTTPQLTLESEAIYHVLESAPGDIDF